MIDGLQERKNVYQNECKQYKTKNLKKHYIRKRNKIIFNGKNHDYVNH